MSQSTTNNLLHKKDQKIAQLEQALAIEAALESVRSQTMRMQKSEELADIASLIFQQLKALKVVGVEDRFHFALHDEKLNKTQAWITEPNGQKIIKGFDFPITQFTPLLQENYARWKNTPKFERIALLENTIYKGKNLDDFLAMLSANSLFAEEKSHQVLLQNTPEQIVQNGANFSHGVLVVTSTRQFAQQELGLLQRFAIVFEQTYTRFLDLQKAETQTREAQIEAALERVRAASMAMRETSQLQEVTKILFQELTQLEVEANVSWISLVNEDGKTNKIHITGFNEKMPEDVQFEFAYAADEQMSKNYEAWKNGDEFIIVEFRKDALIEWLDGLIAMSGFPQFKVLKSYKFFQNLDATNKYGSLGMASSIPFSEKQKSILKRFSKVFEQTYTRFLDLQKAEAQAKEAQIEAALERVRAASMAMHKTEELSKVVTVLFNQFQALDIDIIMAFMGIYHIEEKYVHQWFSPIEGIREEASFIRLPTAPWENTTIKDWKEGKEMSYESIHGAEAIMQYCKEIDAIANWNLFEDLAKKLALDTIEQTEANHQYGNLSIVQQKKATPAEIAILKRFAKVFEQAYTRFLDLQKAEAQAKEAQIEAALERVRARTMAMHKSEELPEAAKVMFEQFKTLGITPGSCAFTIFRNGTPIADNYWASNQVETMAPMVLSHHEEPVLKGFYNAWQAKIPLHVEEVKGQRYAQHLEYMLKIPSIGQSVKEINNQGIALPDRMVFNCANFKYGYVMFSTHEQRPAYHDIFIRFTKVFEQTYTRFLDLQKAEAQAREAQAREAQIEAAMERIRNRAIAMRSSDELKEVIIEMRRQIDALGQLDLEASVIHLYTAGAKMFESFAAVRPPGESGEIVIANILFPVDAMRQIEYMIEMYHSDEQEYTIEFDKTMAEEWQEVMVEHAPMIAARRVGFVANRRTSGNPEYWNFADFSQGSLLLVTHSPASEDTKEVLRKAAQVFDQAYTRFLDLQKAEAQAREAQIEAALERVRAASMAMHKSEELPMVAEVLVNQMTDLGLDDIGFAINTIIDEATNKFILYSADPVEKGTRRVMSATPVLQAGDTIVSKLFLESVAKGEKNFKIEGGKEQVKEIIKFRLNNNNRQSTAHAVEALNIDKVYHHFSLFHGKSNIVIITTKPLSSEFQGISKRFADVFGQSYVRFLDLQKAEAQAREAQIEAALERVRAASMAMHKSEQLAEVVTILFNQLKELNVELIQAFINIINKEKGRLHSWLSPVEGANEEPKFINVPSALFEDSLIKGWLEGAALDYVHLPTQKEVDGWIIGMDEMTGGDYFRTAAKVISVNSMHLTASNFKYGQVALTQRHRASKEEVNIIKRFGKVFEGTYIRFLDIQKAEAQAREAKIEAALERVRAKAMSMHKSEDLAEVLAVIFEQMHQLGFDSYHTILGLIDLDKKVIEFWSQGLGAVQFPFRFEMPIIDNYVHNQGIADWQSGKAFSMLEVTGKTKREYDEALFKSPDLANIPETVKTNILAMEKAYFSQAFTQHGALYANGPTPLPEEQQSILVRFAKVLDLTYTRMLDLQKAETQARELEIVFQENERLLHSILPSTIAEQLKKSPQRIVKRFEQVSILFADIVGFTILSERLSPQEVVDILNGLFSKFDDLTDKYQLEKIKTIGDAYMVASGVPEERTDHALVLFQFAQEMLQAIQDFNQVVGTDLKIRIGISSGPVVAGVIGKKKFAYDLWGDTVNTAARMEAYGQASCIQVAPPSYELLKEEFEFEKIPNVEIKGKGRMDVYVWSPITG